MFLKCAFLIPLSPYVTPCLQHTKRIKYQVTRLVLGLEASARPGEVNVTDPQPDLVFTMPSGVQLSVF